MSIGENIKKKRKEAGVNQYELADKVGVTQGYIAKVENNMKIPSMTLGKAIANVLGCTMDELARE